MYNTFNYNLNILNTYKENFNTPFISLITMCAYMILGMFFITTITEFVNYLFNKNKSSFDLNKPIEIVNVSKTFGNRNNSWNSVG